MEATLATLYSRLASILHFTFSLFTLMFSWTSTNPLRERTKDFQKWYDMSLLQVRKDPLHVCIPSLISRLLAGMSGMFPWSKRYPDCPPTWLSWERVSHDPEVRQTLDERGLALWRASVPLSIHLTWLPRKQGYETGSWEEMWALVCLDNSKETACTWGI